MNKIFENKLIFKYIFNKLNTLIFILKLVNFLKK